LNFQNYDYNTPGSYEFAYRVADNLIGDNLKNANLITQQVNVEMIPEQVKAKSKKTDNFCNPMDFKLDTFRKLYPGPFDINSSESSPNRTKLPETTNQHFQSTQDWEIKTN